ncbi:hypothetical protein DVH24_002241 [Malus domestica]|uniref:Uncharacterized protein n=1 Tax=Malus domestica TaxID=3750 RepID=A0A498IC64_MALDO|nr:hypothetical protein DVH24_002241 [Malus domestica]
MMVTSLLHLTSFAAEVVKYMTGFLKYAYSISPYSDLEVMIPQLRLTILQLVMYLASLRKAPISTTNSLYNLPLTKSNATRTFSTIARSSVNQAKILKPPCLSLPTPASMHYNAPYYNMALCNLAPVAFRLVTPNP